MWLLFLSIVSLFLGIFILLLLHRREKWFALLDGFVLLSTGGIVLLHVLPHSLKEGRGWAILALFIGWMAPVFVRQDTAHQRSWQSRLHTLFGRLTALAISIYAILDGIALSRIGTTHISSHLSTLNAVVQHLPLGLALGWFFALTRNQTRAFLLACIWSGCIALGYFLGHGSFSPVYRHGLMLFQTLGAGLFIHLLIRHKPSFSELSPTRQRQWSVAGTLLGVVFLFLLSWLQSSNVQGISTDSLSMGRTFVWLALESAPALLLAFFGAGLLHAFIRPASMAWLRRGSSLGQSVRGMAFGLPLPICSCSVLPFYQSLSRAGAPGAAAIAFLIATPELGVDAFLISLPLLGVEFTLLRLVTAILAALAVALWVGQLCSPSHTDSPQAETPPPLPLRQRLGAGFRYGFGEMFDHIIPWILVGLLLAALLEPAMPLGALTRWPSAWQVPLVALAGMPLYVCASGTTPLVAILLHKGLSPGAAIAFLLTGPATNITTFGLLRSMHGRWAALAFAGAMFTVSCTLGWLVNGLYPFASHSHSLHTSAQQTAHWLNVTCLVLLGALLLYSLWRCGLRFMIEQIFSLGGHDPDTCSAHDHSHTHDHEHSQPHSHAHNHDHSTTHTCQQHTCSHSHDPSHIHDHSHSHSHEHDHSHSHSHHYEHSSEKKTFEWDSDYGHEHDHETASPHVHPEQAAHTHKSDYTHCKSH